MNYHTEQILGFRNKVVSLVNQGEPGGLRSTFNYMGQIAELMKDLKDMNHDITTDQTIDKLEKYTLKKSISQLFTGLNEFGITLIHFILIYEHKLKQYEYTVDQAFNRMVAYGIAQEIDDASIKNYVLTITQQYRIDHGVASEGIKKITLS